MVGIVNGKLFGQWRGQVVESFKCFFKELDFIYQLLEFIKGFLVKSSRYGMINLEKNCI